MALSISICINAAPIKVIATATTLTVN